MISKSNHSRNGTSQAERQMDALRPDYFVLEERSIADLIAFGKKHAEVLRYFNSSNTMEGNWSAFLEGDPAEMVAYLQDPTSFDVFSEKKNLYSRPHLAVFLVFLQLLQSSHALMNELTKKQLDFFYRQALRFKTKHAVPDQVHLLAKLDNNQAQALIPKGTLLQAGADGNGNPIHYQTDQDLVANQAQIARLMSLFVAKKVTDIALLRHTGEEELDRGFLSILSLVYRQEGTANTPRDYPGDLITPARNKPFDQTIIDNLDALENKITGTLKLRIAAFQRIIQDYHFWNNDESWNTINTFLGQVFKNKNPNNPPLNFVDSRDFDKNFESALGFEVSGKKGQSNVFDGIPDVGNVYDLHTRFSNTPSDQVLIDAINDLFKPNSLSDFTEFMKKRNEGLSYLKNIHNALKATAVKTDFTPKEWNHLDYLKNQILAQAFSQLLGVSTIKKDADFVDLEQELIDVENYFHMKVEDYFFIRHLYDIQDTNPPQWKWQKADELLINAHQVLFPDIDPQSNQPQLPQMMRWDGLYQAEDTSKLMAAPVSKDEPHARWKPFGDVPSADSDPENHFAATIGWAISSPSLALSEGTRTLDLSFTFQQAEFDAQRPTFSKYLKNWSANSQEKGPYPFQIEISTEKEWITLDNWSSFQIQSNEPVLKLSVIAAENIDAFAPLADSPEPANWPTLRLILVKAPLSFTDKNDKEHSKHVYTLFKDQMLESFEMGITVKGLKGLALQTKDGSVDPKKPFTPFGSSPKTADRWYIGHKELAAQKLDSLTFTLDWKNLPDGGLQSHYAPYETLSKEVGVTNPPKIKTDSFKVKLSLVEARHKMDLLPTTSLFQSTAVSNIAVGSIPALFSGDKVVYAAKPQAALNQELLDSDRYLVVELLSQDFLHNRYTELNTRKGLAMTTAMTKTPVDTVALNKVNVFLPEPFTPELKSISIDYTTSLKVDWVNESTSAEDQVIHIEPFGNAIQVVDGSATSLFPQFEAEGSLFIGLKGLQPPQSLSFLFQLAEGSANPDLTPSSISWSYLSGQDWLPLQPEQLLKDTTSGLLSSGIIQIQIPQAARLDHQRMPSGLHWLRAQVDQATASLSDCIAIRTQALSATWLDPGQASDHLLSPLASDTISETLEQVPGIAAVSQPYSSFLGKAAEADEQLYRRASARLRHKRRVLTMWDYENLVLEKFPDIYKAKAISADLWGDSPEPGSVRVVVIPDIRQRRPFDPFEPKVPVLRLREIQSFLQDKAPVFAQIQVQNPRFKYLKLRLDVRFHDMNNFGFFAKQLEQELLEYLAPWAFNNSEDIIFGGKIYPSIIVDFIENRAYVHYIDKPIIELMERDAKGKMVVIASPPQDNEGLLYIPEPDVIIVSAHEHIIKPLPLPEENTLQIRQGIGFATLEFDFRIS